MHSPFARRGTNATHQMIPRQCVPRRRAGGTAVPKISAGTRTVLAGLLILIPRVASSQLSPGPLSNVHSSLEGALQCVKCHSVGIGRAQLKCLSCHTEIAERLDKNR